jgi:hypothetical protein
MGVIAIKLSADNARERALLNRAGYGEGMDYFMVFDAQGGYATYDPFDSPLDSGRTLHIAHRWIEQHWDELETGDVFDVQFILGETTSAKESQVRA